MIGARSLNTKLIFLGGASGCWKAVVAGWDEHAKKAANVSLEQRWPWQIHNPARRNTRLASSQATQIRCEGGLAAALTDFSPHPPTPCDSGQNVSS